MSNKRQTVILLLVILIIGGLFSVYQGQPADFDFLNYHYYNGYGILHGRFGWDVVPARMQSFFNPYMDAFNYWTIQVIHQPKLVGFLWGAISAIGLFFMLKIAFLLLDVADKFTQFFYIVIAAIIGISAPTVISQLGSPMNDAQSAAIVMLALWLLLKYFQQADNKHAIGYLIVAGLCLGVVSGLKLTCAIYAISAVLALLFSGVHWLRSVWLAFAFVLSIGVGFLMADGWWAWKLYHDYANPLFPFFNNIFHSPYYPDISARDQGYGAHGIWQAIIYPFYLLKANTLTTEIPMRDWRFATVLVLAVVAIIYKLFASNLKEPKFNNAGSRQWRFIYLFFLFAYFIWVLEFGIYRYAIPLELLSGIIIVALFHRIYRFNKFKKTILLILTALMVGTTIYPNFGHQPYGKTYLAVQGPALTDNALVIETGPCQSFVIPFFPVTTRFVDPTFPHFDQNALAARVIHSHQGSFYVLISSSTYWPMQKLQEQYDLVPAGPCQTYTTTINAISSFKLCPLKRQNKLSVGD
jgi:hypothetical protein